MSEVKLSYQAVPIEAIKSLARGFGKGVELKGDSEYAMLKKGIPGYQDAIMRHWTSMMEGEEVDQESGLTHAEAILCSAACIIRLTAIQAEKGADAHRMYQRPPVGNGDVLQAQPKVREKQTCCNAHPKTTGVTYGTGYNPTGPNAYAPMADDNKGAA